MTRLGFPESVRVDTAARVGWGPPHRFDSLFAKVMSHDATLDAAIAKLNRALENCVIEGVITSIPLLRAILSQPELRAGSATTTFLDSWLAHMAMSHRSASNRNAAPLTSDGENECILSELAGSVHSIEVSEGDVVEAGALVLVLSAMKMEHEVRSAMGGIGFKRSRQTRPDRCRRR